MSNSAATARILSLDQFRGYTVAGMFLVNFLGGLEITHHVLKHNNTHFSYADSIMPSFLFICGYSYRLTFLRRLGQVGWSAAAGRFLRRSLALILFSLMLYGFNEMIKSSAADAESIWGYFALLLKANLWEVLAIIGAVQLLLLPVIAAKPVARLAALVSCAALHVGLSWSFNYGFVYGLENWMDPYWGTVGKRAWDGGFFGLISWSEVMLAGTLAFDVVSNRSPGDAARRLIGYGALLCALGYGLSCISTVYLSPDVPRQFPAKTPERKPKKEPGAKDSSQGEASPETKDPPSDPFAELAGVLTKVVAATPPKDLPKELAKELAREPTRVLAVEIVKELVQQLKKQESKGPPKPAPVGEFAESPVYPPFSLASGREPRSFLAPPPFVPPPSAEVLPRNYWMMDKRVVTQSFMVFSTGFALALFGLFVLACDIGRLEVGAFRTFGQNPLAAYVIHFFVEHSIMNVIPKDAPLWWALAGLAAFFLITYLFVRFLEKHALYLRL